jgi:hypothetical protein
VHPLNPVPRGDARGRRDYTLLLFMYNAGARVPFVVGELAGIP